MTALADLQSLRDKLLTARASGISLLHNGDQRVAYKTDAEMAAAIADLDRRISAMQADRVSTVLFSSSKGLST